MAASYTEKSDSQGRVRIELSSHMPGWVWSVPFLAPLGIYVEAEDVQPKTAVLIGLGIFAVLVAWFFIRKQSVRLLINPGARTLAVIDGPPGSSLRCA